MHSEMPQYAPKTISGSAFMSKLSRLEALIENARDRREKLRAQIEIMDKAISQFEELRRTIPADIFEDLIERTPIAGIDPDPNAFQPPEKNAIRTLSPDQVAVIAKDLLIAEHQPMKRGQLVKALLARGVPLAGADKNKNLGTILWRNPRMFVTIEGMGYWAKGIPLEGVYDPERDDEPLPKTTFVRTRAG